MSVSAPVAVGTIVGATHLLIKKFAFHGEASAAKTVLSVYADAVGKRDAHEVKVCFGETARPCEMVRVGVSQFRLCTDLKMEVRPEVDECFAYHPDLCRCGTAFELVLPFCDSVDGRISATDDFFARFMVIIVNADADAFYVRKHDFGVAKYVGCHVETISVREDGVDAKNATFSRKAFSNEVANGVDEFNIVGGIRLHGGVAPSGAIEVNDARKVQLFYSVLKLGTMPCFGDQDSTSVAGIVEGLVPGVEVVLQPIQPVEVKTRVSSFRHSDDLVHCF